MYAWGDNDHGQQGNGTTIVNRKPAPVHGLEDVHVNRVACGSSHSIAWTTFNMQLPNMHEPVLFVSSNDPLGASTLGNNIYVFFGTFILQFGRNHFFQPVLFRY